MYFGNANNECSLISLRTNYSKKLSPYLRDWNAGCPSVLSYADDFCIKDE